MRLVFGDYRLDGDRRELSCAGLPVPVEPQVFDVLLVLASNHDRVVSKDDLIASVWGGRIVSESTLTSRITAARQAIGDNGERQGLIKTYSRKGFRFIGAVRREEAGNAAPVEAGPEAQSSAAMPQPLAVRRPDWGGKPSVAVLPFKNLSGDAGEDYVSDGITEDIITALSRYRSIAVIARNSCFAFRDPGTDVRQVGLALGADYLVEGSVRRSDQRIRITAQLVETDGGRQIWADRYDRVISDLFGIQDEITTTLAARIEPEINMAERRRVERKAVPALHAWDFFRLGTKHFYASTPTDNIEAQWLFRRAIELDPGFAEAHGYLCYALVLSMVYFDAEPSEARLAEAVAIGRMGAELDEQDGLVRFMYGRALLAAGAFGDAVTELETAIALNPCLALSHCGLGDTLAYAGRYPEAIPCFEKAIDLSPFDPLRWAFYSYRALAHLLAGDCEAALDWAHRATRTPNAHYTAFAHRVAALGHLGRQDEIAPAVADLMRMRPDYSRALARRHLFYLRQEQQVETYLQGLSLAGIAE